MSLEDTFGESFAEQYEQEKQKRMQERNSVDDETRRAIANKAVEEFRQHPDEPQFTYASEAGVKHDVLLMTLPDLDEGTVFSRFMNQLDSGAVTCPLDYMGEWMSCLFNNEEDLTNMTPGKEYLVIGQLDKWENDQGEMNDQMSPVRGVVSMDEVQKWSSDNIDEEVNETSSEPDMDDINEPEPEPEEEESSGDDDEGGSFLGDVSEDEEEEEDDGLPEEDINQEIDLLIEHKGEEMFEIEEGDERLQDVGVYVIKQDTVDLEEDEEVLEEVMDYSLDYINNHPENPANQEDDEEEEEEEDDAEESLFG
jgi:hypothetical protein